MTTIRPDLSGSIRAAIVGHDERSNELTFPPMATLDIGSVAAALSTGSTRLGSSLSPALAQTLTPTPAWARAAADALDVIGLPAAVLSRSHRLAAANGLMERLIPQVVQDGPPRLGLADRRADAMLGRALLQVRTSGDARVIPLAATARLPPSVIHVFPVQDTIQATAGAEAASCVVVITTVSRPRIASAEVIRDLFDLTPAEARVAHGIAAGKTVHDLASEAGLALGTIRQQLKSVFSKTGVSRQADLVALLVGSALSFPGKMLAGGNMV
jgi:DNA-binding CsgD family transcriptional regulator